ncbi:MAG: ABC transporter permease subunit, partial [Lachnospiraceae bacterium]|nr:ABC transporter permease subunit [Lachnospiraceae bacterium]
AGNYRIFRDIILPQSFPGLFSGILIIFIPAAGSFVEPDIAGGPYGMMIGSLINTQYNTSLNMGYGAALSLILLVLMALALLVINFIMSTAERKIGGKINA